MHYVSIQWGNGPHYVVKGPVQLSEAIDAANYHIKRLQKRLTGVNPTVRILLIVEEVNDIKKEDITDFLKFAGYCYVCGRQTGSESLDTICNMTQPDGTNCPGGIIPKGTIKG